MTAFQALIDFFAMIGAMCFACFIGFLILWVIADRSIDARVTRPLPAEPFQATSEIRKVQ